MKKLILSIALILIIAGQNGFAQELYVDPLKGNDQNRGTRDAPFETLEKAVDIANELTGTGSITIRLFPGVYVINDKVSINPIRIFNDTTRYIIEAVIMPDDQDWSPGKMPVIQSISANNSDTQFPHATGILVAAHNVTIRGLKFVGNPNPEVLYYYPITKEDETLERMEVSQCYFIAGKNSAPIQGGIWAHGPGTDINHCIFYNCRNAILLFKSVQGFSVTYSIIYGAYESAIWMGPIDSEFTFKNNAITQCHYFWVRPENTQPKYRFSDCVITENDYYTGFYTNTGLVETTDNKSFTETNIIKSDKVKLVEKNTEVLPENHLHLVQESVGYKLKAGIFKTTKDQ